MLRETHSKADMHGRPVHWSNAFLYVPLLAGLLVICRASSADDSNNPPAVDWSRTEVGQLLKSRCSECHGGDTPKGELNLALAAGILKGGESGAVVVAGRPEDSLLLERVAAGEMPPDDPLSDNEVRLIREWITAGAPHLNANADALVIGHRIEALMLLRCAVCHGERRREAHLDLRTKDGMLAGGDSGPAAVPGSPADSLLVRRIHNGEMPPPRLLVSVSVKPVEPEELKLLENWIAAGMPESDVGPDIATTGPDPLVSDEDRQFWSFQPPRQVTPPVVKNAHLVDNPIDAFVLRKLEERGLCLSPAADRRTLCRRLYFDLVGLPPTPEEVEEFVNDAEPGAYSRLVDRLLASPQYGPRRGRHWLDAAGYADSEGAQNEDRVRPHMWRYRDYVVRAFNADKPYDVFLTEQLAGDELSDYRHADGITPEIYDQLTATGFLRCTPDRTFQDITNFVPDRLELIADEMQVFGSAVLGLTINCARCHSHKFDPIPQRDYYRLAAVFKDAYDEHDWLKPADRTLPFVTTGERTAWEQHEQRLNARIEKQRQRLEAAADDAERQRNEQKIAALEGQRRPEPRIRALWSRGVPSPTYLLQRGDYRRPGQVVGPGVPSVLVREGTTFDVCAPRADGSTTGRRLALARWVTQDDNPLTARVMVNRIWSHHFGSGLVTTPDNFGTTGDPPSHPELLDWLSVEFVRRDWSIKDLHRLIVTSRTYRQSSIVTPPSGVLDPDGRWLSRMPLRRLEGEPLRDALLFVAGRLDVTPFGPPDDVDARDDGLVTSKPTDAGWRRSIFVLQRRTRLPTILDSFDAPQMNPNCLQRRTSVVAPQALHLLNDATVHQLACSFADRVIQECGDDQSAQITRIHQLAYGRPPGEEEARIAASSLSQLTRAWLEDGIDSDSRPLTAAEAAHHALENYCHAVMNSAEFVHVD